MRKWAGEGGFLGVGILASFHFLVTNVNSIVKSERFLNHFFTFTVLNIT